MRKVITMALSGALLTTLFTASAVSAAPEATHDYTVPHTSEANQASFWVKHFNAKGYVGVTCTKYEDHSGWLPGHYDAGIVKAGTTNFVFLQPDDVGRDLVTRQDPSHILKCKWVERRILEPAATAKVRGPKGDPWFRFIAKNESNYANKVRVVVRVNGNVIKKVPGIEPGCVWKSGWRYVKPFKTINIKVIEQGSGIVLANKTKNSGPGGYFGPLYRGYTKGVTCPT